MKRGRELKCGICSCTFDDDLELAIHGSLHEEQERFGPAVRAAASSPVVLVSSSSSTDSSYSELRSERKALSGGFLLCEGNTRLFRGHERWGSCGYRNLQTLLAAASLNADVPTIDAIQCSLVEAWSRGFDSKSARELGGEAIVGSKKWIGACECLTLVRDLTKRRAHVTEFEPRGKKFDGRSISRFFSEWFGGAGPPLPVMVQWKGHSVSVVGWCPDHNGGKVAVWDPNKGKLFVQSISYFGGRGFLHFVCVERAVDDSPLQLLVDMGFRAKREAI